MAMIFNGIPFHTPTDHGADKKGDSFQTLLSLCGPYGIAHREQARFTSIRTKARWSYDLSSFWSIGAPRIFG